MEFYTFLLLLAVDYGQTKHIESTADFRETNPIIRRVGADTYFSVAALAAVGLNYYSPKMAKGVFLTGSVVQGLQTYANYHIGVKVDL